MNIAQVLHEQAAARGDQLAIADGREALTFAQLNDAARQAAADLAAAGLRSGDRALLFCPMSAPLYVTLIGMFRLGVTAVFVDPSAGIRQVSACCDRVRPRAFVGSPRAHLLRVVSSAVRRVPVALAIGRVPFTRAVGLERPRLSAASNHEIAPCAADTPALITFTSGSTGVPKAAVRTHGFLLAQHRALAEELDLRPGDVDLTTLPIFVLANLASGVTSIIPEGDMRAPARLDPARLVQRLREYRCNRIAASPALLERLAVHLQGSGETLAAGRIFTGGAPVFPALLDKFALVAPGAVIAAVYGSTEAEPIAQQRVDDTGAADRRATREGAGLLAGLPVSSIAVRIIPDRWGTPLGPYTSREFDALCLPVDQTGEIVVSGAHVLRGYLDATGDDETKIKTGNGVWHRTGDAGYMDAAGRLWLVGRCSARVCDAHGVTYPLSVEAAASEIDGVRRSAFLLHQGRRTLLVEIAESVSSISAAAVSARLAWAHLDDVVIVERVPVDKRHNAKVDYPALDALLRRGRFTKARSSELTVSCPHPTAHAPASHPCDRRRPARARRSRRRGGPRRHIGEAFRTWRDRQSCAGRRPPRRRTCLL